MKQLTKISRVESGWSRAASNAPQACLGQSLKIGNKNDSSVQEYSDSENRLLANELRALKAWPVTQVCV